MIIITRKNLLTLSLFGF